MGMLRRLKYVVLPDSMEVDRMLLEQNFQRVANRLIEANKQWAMREDQSIEDKKLIHDLYEEIERLKQLAMPQTMDEVIKSKEAAILAGVCIIARKLKNCYGTEEEKTILLSIGARHLDNSIRNGLYVTFEKDGKYIETCTVHYRYEDNAIDLYTLPVGGSSSSFQMTYDGAAINLSCITFNGSLIFDK